MSETAVGQDIPFSARRRRRNLFRNAVTKPYNIITLISLIVLIYLIVVPLIEMIVTTFSVAKADLSRIPGSSVGDFTTYYWNRILFSPVAKNLFWVPLGNSLVIALFTTILSVTLGSVFAWLMVRTDLPYKKFFSLAIIIPYMLPSWAESMAWLDVFRNDRIGGAQGLLSYLGIRSPDWLAYGPVAIILVLSIHYYAYAYLLVSASLRSVNSELEEMGEVVGASKAMIVRKITLPLLLPSILSAVILTFSKTMGTFGVPSFLGTKVGYYTISTSLYSKITNERSVAFCISLCLILISSINIFINQQLIGSRKSFATISGKGTRSTPIRLGKAKGWITALMMIFLALVVILPLWTLIWQSFMLRLGNFSVENFTTHYWTGMADPAIADGLPGLFRNPDFWRALKNTMLLVLLTSLFASGLGQIIGYICSRGRGTRRGRLVEQLTFIPYLIPSIAFGAMYLSMFAAPTRIELFGTSITIIPSLYATFTLLVLVSVVKHLPYASRSGTSNMMQISRELEEVGEVEGAGFGQRFVRLVMPLAKDGFLSGLMMILISVIKELDLIVMLISPKQETLSYIAYTFSNSGFTQMADGVAIVMFVIVFLLYWGADRFFHADITKGM